MFCYRLVLELNEHKNFRLEKELGTIPSDDSSISRATATSRKGRSPLVSTHCGKRLRKMLFERIRAELPMPIGEIEGKINDGRGPTRPRSRRLGSTTTGPIADRSGVPNDVQGRARRCGRARLLRRVLRLILHHMTSGCDSGI